MIFYPIERYHMKIMHYTYSTMNCQICLNWSSSLSRIRPENARCKSWTKYCLVRKHFNFWNILYACIVSTMNLGWSQTCRVWTMRGARAFITPIGANENAATAPSLEPPARISLWVGFATYFRWQSERVNNVLERHNLKDNSTNR